MPTLPTVRIPDGIYKIISAEVPHLVVDLFGGSKFGPVTSALKDSANESKSQLWSLRNIDSGLGGTEFILENIAARGSFVSASFPSTGAALSGSLNPTIWIPERISESDYFIKTGDSDYIWSLPTPGEFAPVVLTSAKEPRIPELPVRWIFLPVKE